VWQFEDLARALAKGVAAFDPLPTADTDAAREPVDETPKDAQPPAELPPDVKVAPGDQQRQSSLLGFWSEEAPEHDVSVERVNAEAPNSGGKTRGRRKSRGRGPQRPPAAPATDGAESAEWPGVVRAERRLRDIPPAVADLQGTLVPAYRRAVDALDSAAALDLAGAITSGLRAAHRDRDEAARLLEIPKDTSPHPEWLTAQRRVAAQLPAIGALLKQLDAQLAIALGPQTMPGGGPGKAPELPKTDDLAGFATTEALHVTSMMFAVDEIRELLGERDGQSHAATPEGRRAAAAKVEAWRSRPANWAFLVAALRREGLWEELSSVEAPSGKRLSQIDQAVASQAEKTGALADVGTFDEEEALKLLDENRMVPTDAFSPADVKELPEATEENAGKVFAMVASAAPDARALLVRRLAASGRLSRFCQALPHGQIAALMRAVDDREAQQLLQREIEGKGGGTSVTAMIDGRIATNLREAEEAADGARLGNADDEMTAQEARSRAYLWQVLQTAYHALPFGFTADYDAAYDSNQAGLTSDATFDSAVSRAALKSTAMFAVGTLGGQVGSSLLGKLLGRGPLATILGGAGGGALGNVAAVGAGDLVDGELSSGEAYRDAALWGALGGGAVASVGLAGRQYLRGTQIAGARGPASGREFDPDSAGGPIRELSTEGVRVTHRGIDVVEQHLSRFQGGDTPNAAMVARLRAIADGKLPPTAQDMNFYTHELREFVRYRRLGYRTGGEGVLPLSERDGHTPVVRRTPS
jgi:hypothetical protein